MEGIETAFLLQKDLPNCKAGQRFVYSKVSGRYHWNDGHGMNYHSFLPEDVENNEEWFLPELSQAQKIDIQNAICLLIGHHYKVTSIFNI